MSCLRLISHAYWLHSTHLALNLAPIICAYLPSTMLDKMLQFLPNVKASGRIHGIDYKRRNERLTPLVSAMGGLACNDLP